MRTRRPAIFATYAIAAGVLFAPVGNGDGTPVLLRHLVIEGRAVVLDGGARAELGERVPSPGSGFVFDAYDAERGAGIVQWARPGGVPVMVLVSDERIQAVSVAFDPAYRTSRGVSYGDSSAVLALTYGSLLRRDDPGGAYVLEEPGSPDGVTSFDTSCTGRVNQIGIALGTSGVAALRSFWGFSDAPSSCAI